MVSSANSKQYKVATRNKDVITSLSWPNKCGHKHICVRVLKTRYVGYESPQIYWLTRDSFDGMIPSVFWQIAYILLSRLTTNLDRDTLLCYLALIFLSSCRLIMKELYSVMFLEHDFVRVSIREYKGLVGSTPFPLLQRSFDCGPFWMHHRSITGIPRHVR